MEGEYYSDKELVSFLEDVIQETRKFLIIVSPFVRISGRIKGYLEQLLLKKIEIILIYKTNSDKIINIKDEDQEWLRKNKIQVKSSRNLHAKCYINEKYALVTSMNLVDYSIANNFEMGVIFRVSDGDSNHVYNDITNNYGYILEDILNMNCDGSTINFDYNKYNQGYCIRTGAKIIFDLDRPMCDEAWEDWCKSGDPDIPEKYCHYSGEESNGETSVRYPILRKNYRKACYDFYFNSYYRDESKWDLKKGDKKKEKRDKEI